jgi:hypothetical protein
MAFSKPPRSLAQHAVAAPPPRPATRTPVSGQAAVPRAERLGVQLLPRLPWLVLVLVAAGLAAVGSLAISNDTWLGIAGGRELWQHGISSTNTWTRYGSPQWADQQWGAHLVFYGVWRLAGAAGLVALHVALVAGGFGLCLRAAARRGAGPVWSALLLLVVAVASVGELVFVRAQSFSVLAFGVLAWLLARDDGRLEHRVLLALPLLVLWANLHAAVLVGAGVCALYAVSCVVEAPRRSRALIGRALVLAVGACAACLATPFALELPGYLRQTVANADFRRFISEWQPVTLSNSPIFVVVALVAVAVTACAPVPRRDKLFVWALTLAGFTAIRSELWAALAWLVVLPGALERVRPLAGGRRVRAAAVAFALLAPACLVLALVHDAADGPKAFSTTWPPAAARVVRAQLVRDPGLRVFADEPFADWLLVEVPPLRGRLALDSRFEVFGHAEFAELDDLRGSTVRISPRIAAEQLYVLQPSAGGDGRLVRVLEREPGVVRLFGNDRVVVLRRAT